MNKLIILVAVVLVAAVASAQDETFIDEEMTQIAVFADDDGETAKLAPEKQIFRDFCIEARDDVKAALKKSVNSKVAGIFTFVSEIFASSVRKAGDEGSVAVEQGSERLEQDARSFGSVVYGVANTLVQVARGEFTARIQEIKSELNGENVVGAIQNACGLLSLKIKPSLESKFDKTKKELMRSSAASEFAQVIKESRLNNLGCLTTSRVNILSRGCDLMKAVLPTLGSFFQ